MTFTHPIGLEVKRIPVYSGYICIRSSNKETFHLPYMGVGYNMKRVTIKDFENHFPYLTDSSDTNSKPINTNSSFIMNINMPTLNWRLAMGSSLVRIDVLNSDEQTAINQTTILGSVPGYPAYWVSRNYFNKNNNNFVYYTVIWNGTLTTGIQLPAGNYRLLYRALKIFGSENKPKDYESWISPTFSIQYETH